MSTVYPEGPPHAIPPSGDAHVTTAQGGPPSLPDDFAGFADLALVTDPETARRLARATYWVGLRGEPCWETDHGAELLTGEGGAPSPHLPNQPAPAPPKPALRCGGTSPTAWRRFRSGSAPRSPGTTTPTSS